VTVRFTEGQINVNLPEASNSDDCRFSNDPLLDFECNDTVARAM
jgi:hypothetical protein